VTKPEQVRRLIEERFISIDEPSAVLPSERNLAESFGVSRMTVRAGIKLLERDGLLRSIPGAGNVVIAPHMSKGTALTSFTQDARARGWVSTSRVFERSALAADLETAADLGIRPGDEVYAIGRLRLADDVPICVERVRLPASYVPGLIDLDLEGSLYALLATRFDIRISRHERHIRAVNIDAANAELLDVPPQAATLYVAQLGYDQHGRPVERGQSVYRGDRYDFVTRSFTQPAADE
jgi:GntR family transcriptional regulator